MLVTHLCPTLCDGMDYSLPGSSVHEILQAKVLEWVAIPFSRRSSQPRDWTWVSCIAGRFLTTEPPCNYIKLIAYFIILGKSDVTSKCKFLYLAQEAIRLFSARIDFIGALWQVNFANCEQNQTAIKWLYKLRFSWQRHMDNCIFLEMEASLAWTVKCKIIFCLSHIYININHQQTPHYSLPVE